MMSDYTKVKIRRFILKRLKLVAIKASRYQRTTSGSAVRAGERVHADLGWSYRTPLPESQKIAGMVAFYNEKVDIHVDGVMKERPVTKFS